MKKVLGISFLAAPIVAVLAIGWWVGGPRLVLVALGGVALMMGCAFAGARLLELD